MVRAGHTLGCMGNGWVAGQRCVAIGSVAARTMRGAVIALTTGQGRWRNELMQVIGGTWRMANETTEARKKHADAMKAMWRKRYSARLERCWHAGANVAARRWRGRTGGRLGGNVCEMVVS